MALAFGVSNNLCMTVKRLNSVSVFIKMSFTIFTALTLLPLSLFHQLLAGLHVGNF